MTVEELLLRIEKLEAQVEKLTLLLHLKTTKKIDISRLP